MLYGPCDSQISANTWPLHSQIGKAMKAASLTLSFLFNLSSTIQPTCSKFPPQCILLQNLIALPSGGSLVINTVLVRRVPCLISIFHRQILSALYLPQLSAQLVRGVDDRAKQREKDAPSIIIFIPWI